MGDDCIYCITWRGLDLTWCGLDLLMTSFKVGQGIAFIPKDYPLLGYLITLCGIQIIKENVCKQQYSYNFENIDNYRLHISQRRIETSVRDPLYLIIW